MENRSHKSASPSEYLDECRRRAAGAVIYRSFDLWPTEERRPEDLFRTTSLDKAIEFIIKHRLGVIAVLFEWEVEGKFGQAEGEYHSRTYPTATDKFIAQTIDAMVTAKLAQILYRERYPDIEVLN